MAGMGARSDDAVRRAAADWVALVHDADAAVDRAAFERWRAADPRHGTAYARAERAWEHAALLSQTSFGRARRLPERRRFLERPALRYGYVAAALTVVLVLGIFVAQPWPFSRNTGSQATTLASRVGEISTIMLADGSRVTLDTDTALRVAFVAGERRIYLYRGRARFDVAHASDRPFVVSVGNGSVTARGTIFDVSVVDGRVKVALLRGAVDVRAKPAGTAAGPAVPVRLASGQQLAFDVAGALPRPQPMQAGAERWPSGMLTFDRTPLGDVIADANRYSATKIVVADPALSGLRATGAYRAGDTSGLAASLAVSFGFRVSRKKDGEIVLSRSTGTTSTK